LAGRDANWEREMSREIVRGNVWVRANCQRGMPGGGFCGARDVWEE